MLLYISLPVALLLLLAAMMVTDSFSVKAKAPQQTIDVVKYHKKCKFDNVKKFEYTDFQTVQTHKLTDNDLGNLYHHDLLVDQKIARYFYSWQEPTSDLNYILTILSDNGFITALVFSPKGEFIEEFELASLGESEYGCWKSYGEFIDSDHYRSTRITYEYKIHNDQRTTEVVDSVVSTHVVGNRVPAELTSQISTAN